MRTLSTIYTTPKGMPEKHVWSALRHLGITIAKDAAVPAQACPRSEQ
jgi:hypothetical protein